MDKQEAVVAGVPAENPAAGPPEPSEASIAAGQSGSEPLGAKTDDNNAPEWPKSNVFFSIFSFIFGPLENYDYFFF